MSVTLGAALRHAVAALRAAGIAEPARDARLLLAHVTGLGPDRLLLAPDRALGEGEAVQLAAALAARASRQPVSQITGQRLFWGRPFRVTRDTLDPRPETECLIERALALPFGRVLDLGTGTGCILLTLLAERPGAEGLGTDLSVAALAVAAANAGALGLSGRARFVQADWFAGLDGSFDLIVSNPPYIGAAEMATLAPEVRDWEPAAALSPGGDGLDAYRAIARGAGARLAPGGQILVEIGAAQGAAVCALMRAAGFDRVSLWPDLDGRDRIVQAGIRTGAGGRPRSGPGR